MEKVNFRKILEAQEELNQKYSGEKWKLTVTAEYLRAAIFTEIAEFLESSPEDWKWWKNIPNDRQNQYIEVVDVVHFGASLMLKYNEIENMNDEFNCIEWGSVLKRVEDENIYTLLLEFFNCPNVFNFVVLIQALCLYTKNPLSINEVWNGYFAKNQLNHNRVDGGYKDGKYQKINENGEEDNRAISFEE